MISLLLTGGRVIDPANQRDESADVLIQDGRIGAVGKTGSFEVPTDTERRDVSGAVICPGLIDSHVHFREPGQSAKETIATGSRAAAIGGFTSVLCMPNTTPTIDSPSTVALIQEKAQREASVNVYITGNITRGMDGDELAPIGSLKQAGVVAITDDGKCVQNNEMMRRACEYARMFDLPVLDHCQDYDLVNVGVMHEGYWSTLLGLPGWPAMGEEMIVVRNILLAETTGTPIHCQHISSARSIQWLRRARQRNVPITAEACPHHFTLTDTAIAGSDKFWAHDGESLKRFFKTDERPQWPAYDTLFKMNPPLRTRADREAILDALTDGTLEIIGSDHAPHCNFEKEVEFDSAPFGITGLEVELSLSLMQLHHNGRLKLPELIEKFTVNPAKLLRLEKGTLSVGADADITVFDPDAEWVYRNSESASKSTNCPFNGWPMKGRATMTIVGGKIVFEKN